MEIKRKRHTYAKELDLDYNPSNMEFTEWLATKFYNHEKMDWYTKNGLWVYLLRGDDEVELNDEEISNYKQEVHSEKSKMDEICGIKTDVFNFKTPLCKEFKKINCLLNKERNLIARRTKKFKPYDEIMSNWINTWKKVTPWLKDEVAYEKNLTSKIHENDLEVEEILKSDPYLDIYKMISLTRNDEGKTIKEKQKPQRNNNDNMGSLEHYLVQKDPPYFVNEEEEKSKERKCMLLRIPYVKPPTYKIERFEVVKYSFGPLEEYVAINKLEHNIWVRTEENVSNGYQDIFYKKDEWFVSRTKCGEIRVAILKCPVCMMFYFKCIGDEHLDTVLATESDEFIKSSVENLIPNLSESEGENECDVPDCFTTFSNILFDADYDFYSVDDQSLFDEDISKKIYSNHLFDEEIISIKIDPHHFNAESDLIESMLNHDSSIISSSKTDSLFDEFAGELTLLKSILPGISKTDCDHENEIRLTKRLLYDNSSPRPPKEFVSKNFNADVESFSPSPIRVEDSDSLMKEIDLSFTSDDPMPSGIEEDDYDSERDILILEELLDNYSLSLPENESFHFDILLSSRPPAKPPDGNTGILNVKMMGDISEQKVPMPRLMITRVSNQEKSPDLLICRKNTPS
uniref:C2 calcium/lipid-binding domain, CaLB n=1 Tax=Tanacetum cinerariifolium TaxID=118510 RepID=A0A6L2LPD7_TANCI|nr:C2 calcium/lipid-binding domain, CaLB [Tanacetum cinerariifolium]